MTDDTNWKAVAKEFHARQIAFAIGPETGEWMPAEAAAKEILRLREKNDAYHDRLHHPCEGCPGCSSGDCPDALSITRTELAKYKWAVHVECTDAGYTYDSALAEALRERDELQRKLDNNQIDLLVCEADCRDLQSFVEEQRAGIERLQARVAELEAAMAQRMGVYAAPKDERQVGS